MDISAFDQSMKDLLRIDEFARIDSSQNGIQVGRRSPEVQRIAFAVDACLETAKRAAEWEADVLVVHHGLLWGKSLPLTGVHQERVRVFLDSDMALYGVHLPLDAHHEVGNNAVMAKVLDLTDVAPFGEHRGTMIGCMGRLPSPLTVDQVQSKLLGPGAVVLGQLPFGPEHVHTIGLISGGATWDVLQAIDQGLDLFITGDAGHSVYHNCLEAGINVLFAGHYQTETWGVRALNDWCRDNLQLETLFIDLPTGL